MNRPPSDRPPNLSELDGWRKEMERAEACNAFLDPRNLRALRDMLASHQWRRILVAELETACGTAEDWERDVMEIRRLGSRAEEFEKSWAGEEKTFGRGAAFGYGMVGGGFLAAIGAASVIGALAFVLVGLLVVAVCEASAQRRIRSATVSGQIAAKAAECVIWLEARRPQRLKVTEMKA